MPNAMTKSDVVVDKSDGGEGVHGSDVAPEAARLRVRRMLLDPLEASGFRHPRGVTGEAAAKRMAQLADDLLYMSDEGLAALRFCLSTKGEGSRRDFWPSRASVLGFAQAFEPRPLIHSPGLLRWFASRAGPDALTAGRHVAEYLFWERHSRPPVTDTERRAISARAADDAAHALRVRERIGRGLEPFPGDGDWLAWHDGLAALVRGLIDAEVAA